MIDKRTLEQLAAGLARLGPRRLALLAIVGLTTIAVVTAAARYLSRPAMQPIYTALSPQDVARMSEALAEAGVPFDVNEQRSSVLVPFGQAAKARSLLAQRGLPTSTRAGYELFDQMGSLGLTSFMQEVTRMRALEGEIARTIQALDGVAAARVHIVLPDAGSFRRERREPSASVLLRLDARWQGLAGQTVRHIVAAAVPGMKIEQVSVASTDGRLIATGGDEKSTGYARLAEMERAMASELEQRAGRTLASTLGAGNYQVSVTVRLDVDREQVAETTFDPKSRVERSVRIVKQSGSSEDGAAKAAGVEANIPREETAGSEGEKRRQREDRREELINYELNSKLVQTVREGYRVQRLAIATVINRKLIAAKLGAGADAAGVNAQLAELRRLVVAATGANPERGDTIEVTAAELGSGDAPLAPLPPPGLGDYALMNLGTFINAAAVVVVGIILVWFGMRPLTKVLTRAGGPASVTEIANGAAQAAPGLEAPKSPPGLAPPAASAESGRAPALAPLRSAQEDIRARLEALVAADDVKAAKVLKTWIAEGARA